MAKHILRAGDVTVGDIASMFDTIKQNLSYDISINFVSLASKKKDGGIKRYATINEARGVDSLLADDRKSRISFSDSDTGYMFDCNLFYTPETSHTLTGVIVGAVAGLGSGILGYLAEADPKNIASLGGGIGFTSGFVISKLLSHGSAAVLSITHSLNPKYEQELVDLINTYYPESQE